MKSTQGSKTWLQRHFWRYQSWRSICSHNKMSQANNHMSWTWSIWSQRIVKISKHIKDSWFMKELDIWYQPSKIGNMILSFHCLATPTKTGKPPCKEQLKTHQSSCLLTASDLSTTLSRLINELLKVQEGVTSHTWVKYFLLWSKYTNITHRGSAKPNRAEVHLSTWWDQWRLWDEIFWSSFRPTLRKKLILSISTRISCQPCKPWWKTINNQTQIQEIQRLWCSSQPWWSKKAICLLVSWTKSSLVSASRHSTWFLVISSHIQNSEKDSSSSSTILSCIAPREWSSWILKDSRPLFTQSSSPSSMKSQNVWRSAWRACGTWMRE